MALEEKFDTFGEMKGQGQGRGTSPSRKTPQIAWEEKGQAGL